MSINTSYISAESKIFFIMNYVDDNLNKQRWPRRLNHPFKIMMNGVLEHSKEKNLTPELQEMCSSVLDCLKNEIVGNIENIETNHSIPPNRFVEHFPDFLRACDAAGKDHIIDYVVNNFIVCKHGSYNASGA